MRRRLEELLSTSRPGRREPEPVRKAEGGSAGPDTMGTRSSAPDPQRARSTGSRPGRLRDEDSCSADSAPGPRRRGPAAADPAERTVEEAKEACLRLLAVRARSRAELARRLTSAGYPPEVTDQTLERLGEVGLIDDAAFAEQWVHSRHSFSGKGKQALARELRGKGVAPEDAAPALAAISADDEEARAAELVRRKLRTLPADLDRDKAIRRLVGMLARRGYGQSTAYRVVKAALGEHGVDTGEALDDQAE